MAVPCYTVDLDQPPSERWRHVAVEYKDAILAVKRDVDAMLDQAGRGAKIIVGAAELLLRAAAKLGLALYNEELRCFAEVCGIPLGQVVAMQLQYEVCALCTSVAAPMAAAGTDPVRNAKDAEAPLTLARTMDWEMPLLRPLTIDVTFVRGGRPVFRATTWAGYVGVLTGMALDDRAERFAVSVNFRAPGTGTVLGNLANIVTMDWPTGYLVREVLATAGSFDAAVRDLTMAPLVAPCYFTVCGVTDAAVLSRERAAGAVLQPWHLKERGPVVQPNMDHWSSAPEEDIMASRRRRDGVRRYLTKHSPAQTDPWALLQQCPSVCNDITIYAVVMQPATGTYETRFPRDGSLPPAPR